MKADKRLEEFKIDLKNKLHTRYKISFLKWELLLLFHSYSNVLNCDITCQEQAFVAGISCRVVRSYHIIETECKISICIKKNILLK